MPKRSDIKSILIIGAGPIVIGQGCEFDYSGAQACKALREEGYRVILVNSNPATIMTDPDLADSTYIEPIHWTVIADIIAKEKPDALLPTMGGQTALNCALDLAREGILKAHNVELIGASREAIDKAEDREKFRQAMLKIGLKMPQAAIARNLDQAKSVQAEIGFPTIIRPSFTLGGSGGGIAYNHEEFEEICKRGLDLSPTNELLIEESILGWKEYEMEVVRDKKDNCIIVCAIENLDPMGIHTGDSITVAPAQTLTDKEYQAMRNASIAVLREIGVETGGSNVQFAVNPKTGEMVVIEMNPRVSRSSALASKATGFPIARVAAKLAVGYSLDELANEMTDSQTPCSFEPTIDYVVTKIPRFNFEKFHKADAVLTTQMKSVGEVMAIGRTFQESLQKAIRGLEVGHYGLESKLDFSDPEVQVTLRSHLTKPSWDRLWYIADAFRLGMILEEIQVDTGIDPWFLGQIKDLVDVETQIQTWKMPELDKKSLYRIKRKGFSDRRIADLMQIKEEALREKRHALGVLPVYKRVDTCSAEFRVSTAYLYSTYEEECEAEPSHREKIMVLGGGPNRIGQGIEFDYCCVHASLAMREAGYETIMVNCNPETVSTDFDISDKLYFEPLTLEDVLEIVAKEKPKGVIVQFGGQTPLKLARHLERAGVPIIGTSPDAIDKAEDRERFKQVLNDLGLRQPSNGIAKTLEEGLLVAKEIGYPLMVRPSYVLGGRAMEIVHSAQELKGYLLNAFLASEEAAPVLLDRFLDDAIEVDVDAISDGEDVLIGGIMEHIEQAGVHSGDSACSLPPFSLSPEIQDSLREQITQLALALNVKGLVNAQFAIQDGEIYVLEVNPRAARTVPFVSKVIGRSLAKIAALCMIGKTLASQGVTRERVPAFYAVKKSVFPFSKFPSADPILGPEMRSTGEVMGVGNHFAEAFAKSDLATNNVIKRRGQVFISVKDKDKSKVIDVAQNLLELGFSIVATQGTANYLLSRDITCTPINKVGEGRPHIVDSLKNDKIVFIVNTTEGRQAIADSFVIRRNAVQHKVNYETTVAGARAVVLGMKHEGKQIFRLQDLHLRVNTR
jgi:carbamoyl-phosphate synthase large subunit